jgi:hypothetical protein
MILHLGKNPVSGCSPPSNMSETSIIIIIISILFQEWARISMSVACKNHLIFCHNLWVRHLEETQKSSFWLLPLCGCYQSCYWKPPLFWTSKNAHSFGWWLMTIGPNPADSLTDIWVLIPYRSFHMAWASLEHGHHRVVCPLMWKQGALDVHIRVAWCLLLTFKMHCFYN